MAMLWPPPLICDMNSYTRKTDVHIGSKETKTVIPVFSARVSPLNSLSNIKATYSGQSMISTQQMHHTDQAISTPMLYAF